MCSRGKAIMKRPTSLVGPDGRAPQVLYGKTLGINLKLRISISSLASRRVTTRTGPAWPKSPGRAERDALAWIPTEGNPADRSTRWRLRFRSLFTRSLGRPRSQRPRAMDTRILVLRIPDVD